MPHRALELRDKYAPFTGDGRRSISPAWVLPGSNPMSITYAEARAAIDRFLLAGMSSHPADGSALWVLIQWLQFQQFDYTLEAAPGFGYTLFRKNHRGPLNLKGK